MISNKYYPTGWNSKRLKYSTSYNDEVLPEDTGEFKEINYVEISGVSLDRGIELCSRLMFHEAPSRARRIVRAGDVLVSTVRTYLKAIATVGEVTENLIASTGFCVIRPGPELGSGYLGWVAKSNPFVDEVVSRSVGVSYPAISASELATIKVPLPPHNTQCTIATFLNKKTARIDALIEKKRALLDRLAEQRQALITQAVTKGLSSDTAMKPSGIGWLGEVPSHWQIKRLRYMVQDIEQGWSPQCENRPAEKGEWGVLKVGCVNGEFYNESENKALPPELDPLEHYEVQPGDILVSRANTRELLGSAAIVENTQGRMILCDKLYRIKLDEIVNKHFLTWSLRSSVSRFQYEREATGTSGSMQNIGQDTLKNLVIALPPAEEQQQIVLATYERLASQARIATAIEASIAKLFELRAALITSAVTGMLELSTEHQCT